MKLALAILLFVVGLAFMAAAADLFSLIPDERDRPALFIPKPPEFKPATTEKLRLAVESVIEPAPTDYIFQARVPIGTNVLTWSIQPDWPDQVWIESSDDMIHWRLFATLNDTNALPIGVYLGAQFFRLQL